MAGFVGSPWTLAAYSVEKGGTKDARIIKDIMYKNPELAHSLLDKMATLAGEYACHQIEVSEGGPSQVQSDRVGGVSC